jgi:DNA mismatch endonuclease (patch repair protein)
MKTPSFSGLKPASAASSSVKRANRRSDTAHEILLRQALWRRGLRYRKNVRQLPGQPDMVFSRARVAVFCDGDFWHGRHWSKLVRQLRRGANSAYWCEKIRTNMLRDRRITRLLEAQGWSVIRLWESDIKNDPDRAALHVRKIVSARRGVGL